MHWRKSESTFDVVRALLPGAVWSAVFLLSLGDESTLSWIVWDTVQGTDRRLLSRPGTRCEIAEQRVMLLFSWV
jgi:hypothetical protein